MMRKQRVWWGKNNNKYLLGVGIFDLKGNLISKFKNNVELVKHLKLSKVILEKYLTNNLIYMITLIILDL